MDVPTVLKPPERREAIVRMAREHGLLEVAPLAQELGVSPETLRRDLRLLDREGQIRRDHGTFSPTEIGRFEYPLHQREITHAHEKKEIARQAAALIGTASTIFLDEGVVPNYVIGHLPVDRVLTVVTTSLRTALAVSEATPHEVIIAGGRVRRKTYAAVGPWTASMLGDIFVDLAFIGTNGASTTHGLTTPDPEVAAAKQAALTRAHVAVLLCEHAKFGVVAFSRFGAIEDLDVIVTGRGLTPAIAERYSKLGPRVIRV